MMNSNPSYGRVQGCNTYEVTEPEYDVAIQPNPSYSSISKEATKMSEGEDQDGSYSSISKEATKMSEGEDQDGYVKTNSQSTQRASYLKVIGSTTKEEESVYDITLKILAMLR